MKVLITGCNGLVGSEAVRFYSKEGNTVIGVDNDNRGKWFGEEASTADVGEDMWENSCWPYFEYKREDVRYCFDIDDPREDFDTVDPSRFDLIIHASAQPSHELANQEPREDFENNVVATMRLLEWARKYHPGAVFVYLSTTKVYSDKVNRIFKLEEKETRYEPGENSFQYGIAENCALLSGLHGVFGANKLASDFIVQEYGNYYGMNTVCFRPGCITGSQHKGSREHGFLAYLAKCIAEGKEYIINGYKGKQVRDQIHVSDLILAIEEYRKDPRPGAVYNIGGGKECNISIMEAIVEFQDRLGKEAVVSWTDNRVGDHMWNVHDLSAFKRDYPHWYPRYTLKKILDDIADVYTSSDNSTGQ
jgi:CDP-paratose 2-epimerase